MRVKSVNSVIWTLSMMIISSNPIMTENTSSEQSNENKVDGSNFNTCLSTQKSSDLGYCFGKEVLSKLNDFNEADSFSFANGVDFVRDEKTPRDYASYLDKDPLDFRSMVEDASNLITKRSLRWDLSGVYPGLMMRVGPTLANGVLEFVIDPRLKDRTYGQYYGGNGELSTGRLLAKNLLVPFLLGFKFQLSTLLPILLGLVLLASKKAFLLSKLALIASTVFGNSAATNSPNYYSEYTGPGLAAYTHHEQPSFFHGHHGHGHDSHHHGFNPHRPYQHHYQPDYFRDKSSSEQTTAIPISPDELRDRLERLFVTKQQNSEQRDENKVRNARNYAWTPLNG